MTIYLLRFTAFGEVRKYISTEIQEITYFALLFGQLGDVEEIGFSKDEIKLHRI